jgi:Hemerythrin HHE cation binding domain
MCQTRTVTDIEIPWPSGGDVVDLILADHRLFEDLLHLLRDKTKDRAAVRAGLADVLVAHAEAEEQYVYPTLVRQRAVDEEEVEHGRHEHLEGHERLLDLLEVDDVQSEDFDEAIEELTLALAHHLDEEEREILNPARTGVPESTRLELGQDFAAERNRQLDAGCGDIGNVRRLVRLQQQHVRERGDS